MNGFELVTIDQFHACPIGADEKALHEAFRQCGATIQARGCSTTGLAVHSKKNLDGAFRSVFRGDVIKVLDCEGKLKLNGITIQLLRERHQDRELDGLVLGTFANPSKLNKIIACCDAIDIAFPPWAAEDTRYTLKRSRHDRRASGCLDSTQVLAKVHRVQPRTKEKKHHQ